MNDLVLYVITKVGMQLLHALARIAADPRGKHLLAAILAKEVAQCVLTLAGAIYTGSIALVILAATSLPYIYLIVLLMFNHQRIDDWKEWLEGLAKS